MCVRGSAIDTKTILPSFAMLTLNLPADALDMTVREWRLEDVIVAVENAMWDIAEEADADTECPAGLEDDDEEDEEEGGSNLKGRYRFKGDGARGGGG